MKYLLITLLFFPSKIILAQNAWTKNPRTGEIEIKDTKKFPNHIVTLFAKNEFIKRWYLHSLTDVKEANLKNWLNRTDNETTYLNLPKNCYFERKVGSEYHKLSFEITILVKKNYIIYHISKIDFSEIGDDSFMIMKLEDILAKNAFAKCTACRKSLEIFKERLYLIKYKK